MASLEELRKELDEIDSQLVKLYEKRMEVCEAVGEYKVHAGRKVYDRQRENEKMADVVSKVDGEFNKKGVRELYRQLMSMSRKLQYRQLVEAGALGRLPFIQVDSLDAENARVVYQGTEGAYSQAAMQQYFGTDVNSFHVRTFREAMEAIEEGSADYAVLPIENSSAGPVNEMYDLLDEFENYIVAETILPVVHTLAGLPGTSLSDIRTVYSKTEALMQTRRFLDDHSDPFGLAEDQRGEYGDRCEESAAGSGQDPGGSVQRLCGTGARAFHTGGQDQRRAGQQYEIHRRDEPEDLPEKCIQDQHPF